MRALPRICASSARAQIRCVPLSPLLTRGPAVLRCGALRSSSSAALSLQVSSPALLLNAMAERYTSTSRILMEFIDNSFDDCEVRVCMCGHVCACVHVQAWIGHGVVAAVGCA